MSVTYTSNASTIEMATYSSSEILFLDRLNNEILRKIFSNITEKQSLENLSLTNRRMRELVFPALLEITKKSLLQFHFSHDLIFPRTLRYTTKGEFSINSTNFSFSSTVVNFVSKLFKDNSNHKVDKILGISTDRTVYIRYTNGDVCYYNMYRRCMNRLVENTLKAKLLSEILVTFHEDEIQVRNLGIHQLKAAWKTSNVFVDQPSRMLNSQASHDSLYLALPSQVLRLNLFSQTITSITPPYPSGVLAPINKIKIANEFLIVDFVDAAIAVFDISLNKWVIERLYCRAFTTLKNHENEICLIYYCNQDDHLTLNLSKLAQMPDPIIDLDMHETDPKKIKRNKTDVKRLKRTFNTAEHKRYRLLGRESSALTTRSSGKYGPGTSQTYIQKTTALVSTDLSGANIFHRCVLNRPGISEEWTERFSLTFSSRGSIQKVNDYYLLCSTYLKEEKELIHGIFEEEGSDAYLIYQIPDMLKNLRLKDGCFLGIHDDSETIYLIDAKAPYQCPSRR